MEVFAAIVVSLLAVTAAVLAVIFLLVPMFKGLGYLITNVFKGIGWAFSHVFGFIFGMIGDVIRAVGAVLTALLFTPLVALNVVIGRWSAAGHFGNALKDELATLGHCVYRVVIGRPARFLLLHGLTEGIERRIPEAVAHAPGSDKPGKRIGQFEGYTIVGSLQGGGSGGRLYVAEPDDRKKAIFARSGRLVDQVVIKSFSLHDGSSLPQIIRESRALEAARKLGLVLDHELTDERFFYVMEFVPGDSLTVVTRRLHAEAGPSGLGAKQLKPVMDFTADLLRELSSYHRGGLWHKDVKPDNIIVSEGRARLVDLGLVTPLRSAMTLTTHGTEYFRDPELVRMALRGAKVRDVDGVKFDIYGVGAVLYSVIENSFPAHGGLSQVSKTCPEALRWVIRRAMTELHKRYVSADEMLADLRTILAASDPFAVKPADLPSVAGGGAAEAAVAAAAAEVAAVEAELGADFTRVTASPHARTAGAPAETPRNADAPRRFTVSSRSGAFASVEVGLQGDGAQRPGATPGAPGRRRPAILVTDWLTGRYVARDQAVGMPPPPPGAARAAAPAMPGRNARRGSATDQLARAQQRVARAQARISRRITGRATRFDNRPNAGVLFATIMTIAIIGAFVLPRMFNSASSKSQRRAQIAAASEGVSQLSILTDRGVETISVPARSESEGLTISGAQLQAFKDMGLRLAEKFRSGQPQTEAATMTDGGAERATVAAASIPMEIRVADASAPRGSVLILDMLPSDVASAERGTTETLASGLRRGGFLVRGLGSSAEETDLLAAGKRVVELSSPEDAEAVDRVRTWLNESGLGLDAALWIGQGAERGSVVRRLVVRDGVDPDQIVLSMPAR